MNPAAPQIAETNPEVAGHANCMIMLDCRVKLSDLPPMFGALPEITHKHVDPQAPTFTFQFPILHRCVRDFYQLTENRLLAQITDFSSNIIKQNLEIMFRSAATGLLMEQDKISNALELEISLQETIDETMSAEFVYAEYILTAELFFLQHKKEKYAAAMRQVKDYITEHNCQYLLKNVAAYEARNLIFNGEKAAAELWLTNYYVDEAYDALYKLYRNFTTVRALIFLGHTDQATGALNRLKGLAERFDRLLDIAEADILLSIIDWNASKKKEARLRLLSVMSSRQRNWG